MRFRFPPAGGVPLIETVAAVTLPLPENTWSSQLVGFSAQSRIQPKGRACTWHVEYGATTSYGSSTTPRALPGKLTAIYRESWADDMNGWRGGLDGLQLTHQASETNFVRANFTGATIDQNHLDGIGFNMLGPYLYCGRYVPAQGRVVLGGGLPDLRGATVARRVRGNSIVSHGCTFCPWIQGQLDKSLVFPPADYADQKTPNWANTANSLNATLALGSWQDVTVTMRNRHADWTFASHQTGDGKTEYVYGELDAMLRAVDINLFVAMAINVDFGDPPTGTIDVDNFVLTYRNHSVCASSNGGTLVSDPGGDDASVLADGDRTGTAWTGPLGDFVYQFADPITLDSVTVVNNEASPSEDVEVLVSADGSSWTSLGTKTLSAAHADGPNHNQAHWDADDGTNWEPVHGTPVSFLKVSILSKYGASAGLCTIEAHGSGATEQTEDDWYDVNQDIAAASGTWHYRIVATTEIGTTYGPDQTVVVP